MSRSDRVNNRDLRDFCVDLGRTALLREAIPAGVAVVSESGIAAAEQLRELEGQGVDAVLVGESLMRAPRSSSARLRGLLGRSDMTALARQSPTARRSGRETANARFAQF